MQSQSFTKSQLKIDAKTQGRLERIQQLLRQKEEIEIELVTILNPPTNSPLPPDFSIKDKVLAVIQENASGIGTKRIVQILQEKYPSYGLERKQIASALAYLKNNTKQVDSIGRGIYVPKQPENA